MVITYPHPNPLPKGEGIGDDEMDFLAESDKIIAVFSPLPPGEGLGVRAGR